MSVVLQLPPSSLAGAFYDDEDGSIIKNVDWGTLTPINSVHEVEIDHDFGTAITKRGKKRKSLQTGSEIDIPKQQSILQLPEIRQRFTVVEGHPVPEIRGQQELLVKIQAIGLNPVDWKSV